jgi:hypothetical protein
MPSRAPAVRFLGPAGEGQFALSTFPEIILAAEASSSSQSRQSD